MSTAPASVPGDTALPQLHPALDERAMLDAFREGLKPVESAGPGIQGCALERFRYRTHARAILLYRLTLPGRGPLWATGMLYPGNRARRLYRRLKPEASRVPGLPFRPVAYLRRTRMLVQLFPFDRHLPSLAELASSRPADVVRYRPGIGAVLRDADDYVKVYRTDKGREVAMRLDAIGALCDRNRSGFDVVRTIGYDDRLRALRLRAVRGRSLEEILLAGGSGVEPSFRAAARALAAFHRSGAPIDVRRDRADEISRVVRAARFLGWSRPERRTELASVVAGIAAQMEDVDPRPTHFDLKADHVYIDDDGRIVFIDLDSAALGDPVSDAATLATRLSTAPRLQPVSRELAESAAGHFVDEYRRHVPAAWHRRLGVHRACAALKIALFFVKHLEPGWPAAVDEMIGRAVAALDGGRA